MQKLQFRIIILWHIAKLQQANYYYLETVSFEALVFLRISKNTYLYVLTLAIF